MINWMVFEVSLPYPSYEFLILFCKYWAMQSIPAVIMFNKLANLLDKRLSLRLSEIEKMKQMSFRIALSPVGLPFILFAIYRNRR